MSAINWRDHDQTKYLCKDLSDHLALFSGLVILLHASVYFIFPSTYIESQRQTILKKSQALAKSFQGQEEGTIESVIDLYSKTNDIKVSIKGKEKQNALEVKDDLLLNPDSQNNSLVIEERKIQTKEGKDLTLQFLATVDSQRKRGTSVWASFPIVSLLPLSCR